MAKARKNKATPSTRVLYVTSEVFPLIKTGGLADVSHALPNALTELDVDVRLLVPAYRQVLEQVAEVRILGWLDLGALGEVRILETAHPALRMPVWLVDQAALFDREGNPYSDPNGQDWQDNPLRFSAFSRAAALLGLDALGLGWRPDVVHAHDWQAALTHAFLEQQSEAPRRLYTIHNLAYDCQFDYAVFQKLKLPPHWWSVERAEFYDRFSMMKAGLMFSDVITTVSPTYAEEICTPDYGYGYADILRHRRDRLVGILNGIDTELWNPASDNFLAANYMPGQDIATAKQKNRIAMLQAMGYAVDDAVLAAPMIGFVGRLVYQKGVDLLLDVLPDLISDSDVSFALVGTGEPVMEQRLRDLADAHPRRVFVHLGYSEAIGHLLEAGVDIFAMPSRYEPCGLNQMYSLHYGTPPVVRRTGGLADTVVDTTAATLKSGQANGFVFDKPNPDELAWALRRALEIREQPANWRQLIETGMAIDFAWNRSAREYLKLYRAPTLARTTDHA